MAEQIMESELAVPEFAKEENRDLGFGSVVAEQSGIRFLNRDGTFNVRRDGVSLLTSLNLYHALMTMSWRRFLSLMLLLYFVSNLCFGAIYALAGPTAIVDTSSTPLSNEFLRGFFFSVQTFATIGYGTIHPVGVIPNLLVTIESYYSLIANALITGIVFARFARPTSRVVFSNVAVIAPYKGITAFMFRLVNGRSNQLIGVSALVMFARFVYKDGKRVRQFDVLELERRSVAFFPLTWTVVHPIDENSPVYGMTEADLRASEAEFLVLLTATDETFATVVHQRSSYKSDEIRFGSRFVSVYGANQPGEPISINIKRLSKTEQAGS